MTMQIITLQQGTPDWHQHRAKALNASDAPAMLGISPYKSRADLVQERATGVTPEVTPAQQRIFDRGHAIEALARPLAEAILGDDLSPCVGMLDGYSASFDGITFDGETAWECKTLNDALREAMPIPNQIHDADFGARLPEHYRAQMEQQAMVSECKRILFTAASFDAEGAPQDVRHCWYMPDPVMRSRLIAGWEKFQQDVAAWVPTEKAAPVVAAPMESLPVVVVQVQGALTVGGNLPAFGDALRTFIARIPAKPSTDQEFADAEAACKALKKAEDALESAESQALAQIDDVEIMRRTVADLRTLARSTRLATEKLVAAEKDARKLEVVQQAQDSLIEHIMGINLALQKEGAGHLPTPPAGLFAPCVKGLKSLDSMREKVTAELIAQQAQANTQRDCLLANRASLRRDDGDWIFLFADFAAVGTKAAEDFQALASLRINKHKQAEAQRLEQERERIRREEQERADREAREKLAAEERAAQAEIAQASQQGQIAAPLATDLSGLVAERHAEGVAALDANQAIGAAQASAAAAETGETMNLSQINALLAKAGVKTDAAGIEQLGFTLTRVKNAAHLPSNQFEALCKVIARALLEVSKEKTAQPVRA